MKVIRICQRTDEAAIDVLARCLYALLTSLLRRALLGKRKGVSELAVEEEVGKSPTGAPGNAVCPSLHARISFIVHEHTPADNKLTVLSCLRSSGAGRKDAIEVGLKDQQRISSRLDMTAPCRHVSRVRLLLDP